MATETLKPSPPPNGDRVGRGRPFSKWMKKLTNFKTDSKRNNSKSKHASPYIANPLQPAETNSTSANNHSLSTISARRTASVSSTPGNNSSYRSSLDGSARAIRQGTSAAPTVATDRATARSLGANTAVTAAGQSTTQAADSTFSSPAPSLRSLATTLTTVNSTALGLNQATTANTAANSQGGYVPGAGSGSVHFSHQYPISPPPASALPSHLSPHLQQGSGHPSTYTSATANNLLTDNASILTLASSSRRRRRRSMDTDASVRALAPSSLFGGSRESLPLSVLSTTVEGNSQVGPSQTLASRFGSGANAERASIYSATGVAPALASERNSFYGGSVRSGVMGHGASTSVSGIPGHAREGSISGSFVGSPLAAVASNEEKKENNEKS